MTTAIPNQERNTSRSTLLGAAVALGLGSLLLGASPADAGNEFKNAFEDELGRIVAHHVAAVGHAVIAAPIVHREVHYERRHRRHDNRHYRGNRGWKHRGHHRHHRSCGHSVTVIKRYKHDRHDRYDRRGRYERHARHDRHDRHDDRRGRRSRYDY